MHALALADKEEEHVGLLASANEMKVRVRIYQQVV